METERRVARRGGRRTEDPVLSEADAHPLACAQGCNSPATMTSAVVAAIASRQRGHCKRPLGISFSFFKSSFIRQTGAAAIGRRHWLRRRPEVATSPRTPEVSSRGKIFQIYFF